jgi:hypothetical protein
MSPDWSATAEAVPYASLGDPQSLNLYGYVVNNPLSSSDIDGHTGNCPDPGNGGPGMIAASPNCVSGNTGDPTDQTGQIPARRINDPSPDSDLVE